jgi:hypothetical protein
MKKQNLVIGAALALTLGVSGTVAARTTATLGGAVPRMEGGRPLQKTGPSGKTGDATGAAVDKKVVTFEGDTMPVVKGTVGFVNGISFAERQDNPTRLTMHGVVP